MALSAELIAAGLDSAEARGAGILSHAELANAGLTTHTIARLLREGSLIRLRRGVYARADAAASTSDRQRLFVQASMVSGDADRVASHWSAAALHHLPLIGTWPSRLHIIDPNALGGSSSSGVLTHRGHVDDDSLTVISGVRATSFARTVADMCAAVPFASAVAMVDEALRRGNTVDELLAEWHGVPRRYGHARAERAINFGDRRAANAGESVSRARIHELGYASPELQVPFTDTRGKHREVDFFWTDIRKIGEFDGIHKYTRLAYTGDQPPVEIVVKEKQREDALRPLVNSFDRWLWADAISPTRFDRYLRDQGMPRA